ncbi:hypothetical protein CDD80_3314 [Ophiocordyceps camponoti-rufipedis]|uniref:Homeobox domain-containing protein n=1 Tax=Ophiocordyceps camponoti-rufipedis TaxID=2004952 RepID=A0A2C5Z2L5_9HYPO|nr:hypothetical protein CDD80_3314 [Ophiocordyceps camponoti-rufipedis]
MSTASSSSSSPTSHGLPWPLTGDASEQGPDGDAAKHPKGRRKRTAAKDKVILEEAYQSNPKPDKQARLAIVQRVTLNEKEVQIWFQNRRQNDRRKSRPLSPEELAALKYSGLRPSLRRSFNAESDELDGASDRPFGSSSVARYGVRRRSDKTPPLGDDSSSLSLSQVSDGVSQSFTSSVGYLANRWNIGASGVHHDALILNSLSPSCSSDESHKTNKSQGHFRLSLSLEGKAELVSNQPSPGRIAPPRPSSALSGPPLVRRGGLQRSHSALPTITLPPISALTSSLPPRLVRGRSRDVQAWESCADSETRDELTTHAEHESSGSAIAAISLLRSSSAGQQAGSAKRNASLSRPVPPRQTKKPKVSRTGFTQKTGAETVKAAGGKVKVGMLISPNDSDKENWSPGEDDVPRPQLRRRLLPSNAPPKSHNSRRSGRVLEEQKRPGLAGNRAYTAPLLKSAAAGKGDCEIYEDTGRQSRDDEVQRFMRGDISPSKKGDMDCVAGLLSLSQGNWR